MEEQQPNYTQQPYSEQPYSAQPQYGTPPPYGTQAIYQTPYVKPQRTPYSFTGVDAAFACFALALGFLVYEWRTGSSLGTFLLIMVALIGTLLYLNARGFKQNLRSIMAFAACILGALPLLLYDKISINALLFLFTICACFYWILVTTGNSVENRISGYVIMDWINQTFPIPFSNFLGLFVSFKTASKKTKRGKSVLIGVVGICIAIPLIIGVASLLINSDAGFQKFAEDFSELIGMDDIGRYLLQFIGGVPIACYIFGAVCGNIQKRYTTSITKESTDRNLLAARRIPHAAILAPLAILCILYIVYMGVMSVYLFSAFAGDLPEGFTYAEYARNGFFELCGVAAINLFIMIFTYSFAKRAAGEYPKHMRVLTGLLCIMTELLVATAVSKMLMYIGAYGLSQLRVYVLWFLVLLFIVYAILIVWHIKPYISRPNGPVSFNAGRPIVILSVCFVLALFLANTDGLIAKYNIWQYESGKTQTVDTYMLSNMSDAVVPHLAHLQEIAKDSDVRESAGRAIARIDYLNNNDFRMLPEEKSAFRDWNIQSVLAREALQNSGEYTADDYFNDYMAWDSGTYW